MLLGSTAAIVAAVFQKRLRKAVVHDWSDAAAINAANQMASCR